MVGMANEVQSDPRTAFAAERTFLAWIRTGLALMGVGFAVSRFGLFLRELGGTQVKPQHTTGMSVWGGIGLVALGVVVTVSAIFDHLRVTRLLRDGAWQPGQPSRTGLALAGVLAVAGVAMVGYLLLLR